MQNCLATETARILPIPEHPGYYVSDKGEVFSARRNQYVPGLRGSRSVVVDELRPVKALKHKRGYFRVPIDGTPRKVHHLVLSAFVGPRPDGMDGCHNDGNPANNALENLRWDTTKANCADAVRHGTFIGLRVYVCQCGREIRGYVGYYWHAKKCIR